MISVDDVQKDGLEKEPRDNIAIVSTNLAQQLRERFIPRTNLRRWKNWQEKIQQRKPNFTA